MEPAKRQSKNRDAGTLELKAATSIKREDIKACLIERFFRLFMKSDHKKIEGKLSLFNKIMQEHILRVGIKISKKLLQRMVLISN